MYVRKLANRWPSLSKCISSVPMASHTSCVCGSTPRAVMMRCNAGVPRSEREIAQAVKLVRRRLGQIVKSEISIAGFIGLEMAKVHLIVNVPAIGDYFAISVLPHLSSREVVYRYEPRCVRAGDGNLASGQ